MTRAGGKAITGGCLTATAWTVTSGVFVEEVGIVILPITFDPVIGGARLTSSSYSWPGLLVLIVGLNSGWSDAGDESTSASSPHSAKTRYRQADSACKVARVDDGNIDLEFSQPHWAVTPGQSVVLYDSKVCLGGAVIT